jgi:hypothetical protein
VSAVAEGGQVGARCSRLTADGGGVRGKKDYTFCSKNWLVRVDRHTGGWRHPHRQRTLPCNGTHVKCLEAVTTAQEELPVSSSSTRWAST